MLAYVGPLCYSGAWSQSCSSCSTPGAGQALTGNLLLFQLHDTHRVSDLILHDMVGTVCVALQPGSFSCFDPGLRHVCILFNHAASSVRTCVRGTHCLLSILTSFYPTRIFVNWLLRYIFARRCCGSTVRGVCLIFNIV